MFSILKYRERFQSFELYSIEEDAIDVQICDIEEKISEVFNNIV